MDVVTLGMAKADAKKKYAAAPAPQFTAALFGDSITARNFGGWTPASGETTIYNDSRGWFHHANNLLGHPFDLVKNAGVGGNTTTQMLARITDITAINPLPAWLLGLGGINDQGALNPALTISNLKAIFTKAFDAGYKRIVWGTITPDAGNTGQRWTIDQVNDWLKAYAAVTPNFILVNWNEAFLDPTNGNPRTGYTSDGLHPAPLGAAVMGQYLADVLRPLVPASSRLLMSNSSTVVSANPMLNGSVSGVATGYNQAGFTAYKMPRYDGRAGEWQMLISAAAGGATLVQNVGVSGGTFTPGDVVFAELEFETDDDWTAATEMSLSIQMAGDASVNTAVNRAVDMFQSAGVPALSVNPRRGIMRTPRITVPAGVTTAAAGKIILTYKFDGIGTTRIARMGVYKVVAA
ncbi:GDSL-type esterase/lipase family protein [Arthrobacter sp. NicSoilC5]|uniref:SGNH/GDSL hydrolase family protein n=1 Tax=Arthrobacter sp. NicSoilC5 TaxID=2831000 RepID=UPI001CC72858|nr:GDSL-type esterase/lipase family protein [Arthrobacter sp. NicSoilC5]BCW79021.1 hypothetical protein NicSoilC5_10400 [Arthrobacter sp. NicSoilC5]